MSVSCHLFVIIFSVIINFYNPLELLGDSVANDMLEFSKNSWQYFS